MSEPKHNLTPYKNLGSRLRSLRERLHESVAEVSGAVEIDPENLERIEQGEHRPSEDVLLLLINHLDPQEDEAVRLWELAGYDQPQNDDATISKPIVVVMQNDTRILYSDAVNVVTSDQGVVVNFLQNQGNGQAQAISRIGMSKEQAVHVIEALGVSLQNSVRPQRSLPAPEQIKPDQEA